MDGKTDYYAALGVSEFATQEEIKRAYRRQAQRFHPDSRTENVPTTLFHEAQAAYSVLGDAARRRAYDQLRSELGLSHGPPFVWDIVPSRHWLYAGYEEQVLYLLMVIRPAEPPYLRRLPLNLCLVVDRSTSMQGLRLENVKRAAREIIDELHDDDALAMVTFSDRAQVLIPSQVGVSRSIAKARVSALQAGGGTEILQGIQAGLSELRKRHTGDVTSHLILLTDGHTYGDEDGCLSEAGQAGAEHIGITTMGIGEDWNEAMLDGIASRSGGVSAYIASPSQVRTFLHEEVRGLGAVYAQGMRLSTGCAEHVQVESAFSVLPQLRRLVMTAGVIDLGTLEMDRPMVLVLQLGLGPAEVGEQAILQLELSADIPLLGLHNHTSRRDVVCTFTPAEPPPELVPLDLFSALRKVTLYCLQEQAWSALESGNDRMATARLRVVSTRLSDMGETHLAEAALSEAGRISGGGAPTPRGRKMIKYGTRSLGHISTDE
jgi:Ca-activated chloride channel family protein